MDEELMTVEAAGRALGVSRSTVWRLIQRGELSSVRRGGRRLVQIGAGRQSPAGRRSKKALAPLTPEHPIFRLVGAGRGGGRVPGARNKHAILD